VIFGRSADDAAFARNAARLYVESKPTDSLPIAWRQLRRGCDRPIRLAMGCPEIHSLRSANVIAQLKLQQQTDCAFSSTCGNERLVRAQQVFAGGSHSGVSRL